MKNLMLMMGALTLSAVDCMGGLSPALPELTPDLMFKDGDDAAQIMTELGNIEQRLSTKLDARLDEIKNGKNVPDQDPKIKALETEHAQLKADLTALQTKMNRPDLGGHEGETKSAGRQFVDGVEFKGRGTQFSLSMEMKALTTGTIGNLPDAQRLPLQEAPTEPHIRDLIPSGETSNSKLTFPQRKLASTVNAAAMVAEGAAKPESSFAFEMVDFGVKKIAHWIKASDELLEDLPGLQSYIDSQLIDGLRDVEDGQILKGDGTGQNLLGLYTVATAFNRAKAGDTLLDKLIRSNTQLRLVNRSSTGYVLNPEDWEEIMLLKGTDNNYIWLNVLDGNGNPRLIAKPVRDTTKLAKGEWLNGDFRRGAQLFDRRAASITVANQNQDDFIKNMVTILGEERLALVIYDWLSFIKNAPAV